MPTRAELLFKRTAALAAALTALALWASLSEALEGGPAFWAPLGLLYLTGVSYGLSEMARLYQRHKRRCRPCFEGAGPHLRWWGIRLVVVAVVAVLPLLFLVPVLAGSP